MSSKPQVVKVEDVGFAPRPDVEVIRTARLHALVHLESHEGRNGRFFGSRLPIELLCRIAHQLDEQNLITMTHVSKNWRKALLAEPKLWWRLEELVMNHDESINRVSRFTQRSRGELRFLELEFDNMCECDSDMASIGILRSCLQEIVRHDGARKLDAIEVTMRGYEEEGDVDGAFECLAMVLQVITLSTVFCQFAAINLKWLNIDALFERFPSGAPFFAMLPQLQHFLVSSVALELPNDISLPDVFSATYTGQRSSSVCKRLEIMSLYGCLLMDTHFPDMPALRIIDLLGVRCDNLYELLSKAAWSLQDLRLASVETKAPARFIQPEAMSNNDSDLTPVLQLPRLLHFRYRCERKTSSFWTSPTNATSLPFNVETGALKTLSFNTMYWACIDYDQTYIDEALTSRTLEKQELINIFRQAPMLQALDLGRVLRASSPSLLTDALSAARGVPALTHLIIGAGLSDNSLETLHSLTPNLRYLDVRETGVTLPALARFANRLRNGSPARLRTWLDKRFRLTVVSTKPVQEPKLSQLRLDLRNLLVTLSGTQVAHLVTQLVLNSPPNGPTFPTVKAEIFSLASCPTTRSSSAIMDNSSPNGAGNYGGKKPGKGATRSAAPALINDSARRALTMWQVRREQEQAIEWFESSRLDLVWEPTEDFKTIKWDLGLLRANPYPANQ
ncbi:BQ2448_2189 [Microbotryum intermedium]|uniref:BQ2448_2189 protein n=1 Tax=Microbotryum intermedium TaxID=269621 RepID=A0A238F8T0_9BASI|nr:BQ2448_2189 [Microbotryum intermedium]